MGVLTEAVMTERSAIFRPAIYTAESSYLTSADAQKGFTVTSQIEQNTYFLIHRVGVQIAAINGGGQPLRVPVPSVNWGTLLLIDPMNRKQYFNAPQRQVLFPGNLNNTVDLDNYLLVPGSNYVALELKVDNAYGNNALYAAHFFGIEFKTRIPVDINEVQSMAIDYMPPPAQLPLEMNARRMPMPVPADIPSIKSEYSKLLAQRADFYNKSLLANNNAVIATNQFGRDSLQAKQWWQINQALNTAISNCDDRLASLRSQLQGANSVN